MRTEQQLRQETLAIDAPERCDIVRRRMLAALQAVTGRDTIIYGVDVLDTNPIKAQFAGPFQQITLSDKDGFDEVTRSLDGPDLDVILHSPGGSAEAAESIVEMLRARFRGEIRFIIPNLAKSAATMLAMSGDWLIMDERSELGPTDPQLIMPRDGQQIVAPAQAIKDQFAMAQGEINGDPKRLPGWVPLLQQYGPALLAVCDNHIKLANELVATWLARYMFADDPSGEAKAGELAGYLANHNNFKSHGRRVGIRDLQERGAKIINMNDDPALRNAVTDVYTALRVTFTDTGAVKLFENHKGEARITAINIEPIEAPPVLPPPTPRGPGKSRKPSSQLPRGQRRH